jgi:hypothetical protein
MRPDTIWKTVVNRRELDVGFKDAESALDVGERLVTGNGLAGREVRGVCDQREFAVEEFGLGHSAGKAAVGAPTGGAAPAGGLPLVLRVEFLDHLIGHGLEFGDARPAPVGLLGRTDGIIGDDQAVTCKGALGQARLVEGKLPEGLDQVGVATGGHGQDKLQLAPALIDQRGQVADILKAQQAAVRHQDDALDRKPLKNRLQRGLQRLRFSDIAGVDGMHQREALRGLDHTQHELSGDAARLLVQSECPNVVTFFRRRLSFRKSQFAHSKGGPQKLTKSP